MGNVRVHLNGGPQQGRELTAPTDAAGLPIPRLTIAAQLTGTDETTLRRQPPLLVYERDRRRADGTWEYEYVGSEGRFDE